MDVARVGGHEGAAGGEIHGACCVEGFGEEDGGLFGGEEGVGGLLGVSLWLWGAGWDSGIRTWRRRDSGRHSLKVVLDRKFVKKVGHVELVKLFPRLVSKGDGNGVADSVADVVVEALEVAVVAAVEEVDELSARLARRIRGTGGWEWSSSIVSRAWRERPDRWPSDAAFAP